MSIKKIVIWIIIGLVTLVLIDVILFFGFEICSDEYIGKWKYNRLDLSPNMFLVSKCQTPSFRQKVETGKTIAKDKNIVFCGLIRNGKDRLPLNRKRLEKIGSLFKDYRIVVFENDSVDGTRTYLTDWQKQDPRLTLIPCDPTTPSAMDCKLNEKKMYDLGYLSDKRMEKMAFFRNKYLDYVKQNLSHFDYMMVIDLDISGPIYIDGLMTSFVHKNWDVMGGNGVIPIPGSWGLMYTPYDLLAYVAKNVSYDKVGERKKWYSFIPTLITMYFDQWKPGSEPIPVNSTFGGLALYKITSILNPNIFYTSEGGCEHIGFHKKMSEAGSDRIYVNPNNLMLVGKQGPPSYFT